MSTIYLILGIIGWTAVPILLVLYVVAGRRPPAAARGFDVNKDDHVETL